MTKHMRNHAPQRRFSLSEANAAEDFESFFDETDPSDAATAAEYADDSDDDWPEDDWDEDWDDDDERITEYDDDDDDEAWIDVEMPEALAENDDWVEIYEAGADFYGAVEAVYPDMAGASAEEIDTAVLEMFEGMSEAEIESWFSGLAKAAKTVWKGAGRVAKAAAPVVRKALPIVAQVAPMAGTAIGAAFGQPGIGGMVGNLVGSGAGALSGMMGPTTRVRRPRRRPTRSGRRPTRRRMLRRRPQPRPQQRRRGAGRSRQRAGRGTYGRRTGAYRTGRGIGRGIRGAGSKLAQLLRNPQVQRMLQQGAQGAVNGIFGEDVGLSDAAVIEAIIGGCNEALAEMDASREGALAVEGGYGPDDFESPEAAFETLVALLEGDGA